MTDAIREDTPDSLRDLAAKYQTLVQWSRDRRERRPEPEREEYRAMARRFPGALRELEVLSLSVLEARADAVARVVEGELPAEPWMRCVLAYHRWMRVALWVRARRTSRTSRTSRSEDPGGLALDATEAHGMLVDEAFVAEILAPRDGRMRPVVIDRVARECEMNHSAVAAVVATKSDDTHGEC